MIKTQNFVIEFLEESDYLFTYTLNSNRKCFKVRGPIFEVDGQPLTSKLKKVGLVEPAKLLSNGTMEYKYSGIYLNSPEISLEIIFRVAIDNPMVRFHYILKSSHEKKLTKVNGSDNISYIMTSFESFTKTMEIKVSEFNETVHSFCLSEQIMSDDYYDCNSELIGPILVGSDETNTLLLAYEHGSQVPDAFINFKLDNKKQISIVGVKGNYYDGYRIDSDNSYSSIWLQIGAIEGTIDGIAKYYRDFVLKYMSLNLESRKPYIFYNTWAYQERNKQWNSKKYLDSMNEERILKEIEVAHRIGIEVFVLDTGWYEKTGDWKLNSKRFTKDLKVVKEALDKYNMKLGLWFDPTKAAVSSNMAKQNRESIMTWEGKERSTDIIWETEESYSMCLPSNYYESFAEELIRLVKEVGVTYFKWDAIAQYACSDAKHFHGTETNSIQERKDCYAFQIGIYMSKVVDRLCSECPEAIVDFDITEGHRYVGLGFLSVGKYFLINNGPYYHNIDVPYKIDEIWSNVYVHPGPARARICRTPLNFDKWIPSVLFLTHYLPDNGEASQNINIASLILGQNGIWGDLLNISEEGIVRFEELIHLYKKVREDITKSSMVTFGSIGSSIEIREKISEKTGKGCISIFSESPGKYSYITSNQVVSKFWASEGVTIEFLNSKKAKIDIEFKQTDAKMIFFL